MGEARQKQNRKERFKNEHPRCAYCGAPTTTIDHCPARTWFAGRHAPEGYEFPACEECNSDARSDELVMAVLTRIQLAEVDGEAKRREFKDAVRGLFNNRRDVFDEIRDMPATQEKRIFRERFGARGDTLRHEGWGAAAIGPATERVVRQTMIKLGKALFYKHVGRPFEGSMLVRHCSAPLDGAEFLEGLTSLAPIVVGTSRGKADLSDQFIYGLNVDPEMGVLFSVVQLNPQFIFALLLVSNKARATFRAIDPNSPFERAGDEMIDCRLKC